MRPFSPQEKRGNKIFGNTDSRSKSMPADQMTRVLHNILYNTFDSKDERNAQKHYNNQ